MASVSIHGLRMLWVYYASAIFLFGATFMFVRTKLKQDEETGDVNGAEG
jgi:uncharacterized BrkB/YihY/UPF0761 family membrane protein